MLVSLPVVALLAIATLEPATSRWGSATVFAGAVLAATVAWLAAWGGARTRAAGALAMLALGALGAWLLAGRSWALSPAGAMHEAARWSALAASVGAGVACSRAGTVARLVTVWAVVAAALAVCAHVGHSLVEDGLPPFRAGGLPAAPEAIGACAAIVLLGAVSALTSSSAVARAGGALLAAGGGLALGASASRLGIVVAMLATIWLVWGRARRLEDAVGLALAAATMNVAGLVVPGRGWAVAVSAGAAAAMAAVVLPRVVATAREHSATAGEVSPAAQRGRARRRLLLRRVLLALCVAAVAAAGVLVAGDQVREAGTAPTAASARNGVDYRRLWWREALEGVAAEPVRGEGGQAFRLRVRATLDRYVPAQTPHSVPLQVLQEGGVPAFVLLLAAACAVVVSLRAAREVAREGSVTAWRVTSLGGAVALAIGGFALVDEPFRHPMLVVAGGVAAGGAFAVAAAPAAARRLVRIGAGLATLVLLVPALVPLAGSAAAGRADGRGARERVWAGRAWQLIPDARSLRAVAAARGDRAAVSAVERRLRGRPALDSELWRVAAEVADERGDEDLADEAQARLEELDPARRPPGS